MSRGKRVQRVVIAGEHIEKYFRGEMTVIEGLPDDAEFVKMWDEPAKQEYHLMFESEEFPVVPEGEPAPINEISVVERRANKSTHWVCPNCFSSYENGDVKRE